MTLLKSLILYLGLQLFSQAQVAAGRQYGKPYGDDGRLSPPSPTKISPTQAATPVIHSSQNKWQNSGDYSWYFPKETNTEVRGDPTGHSQPHPTGADADIEYDYRGLFPPHPRETRAPNPSYSVINVGESSRATKCSSEAVVLPTTGTNSSAVYPSSSTRPSTVSASVSLADLRSTLMEIITLVPTPLIQTPRWVTKRSVTISSPPSPKASTIRTSLKKSVPKPSLPATCASGKFYTVVGGDTCEKIASEQKVPVGRLILQNKLPSTCNTLQIGQKLCVPQCKSYTVQPGDFCFKVTNKFNIELSDLLAANP